MGSLEIACVMVFGVVLIDILARKAIRHSYDDGKRPALAAGILALAILSLRAQKTYEHKKLIIIRFLLALLAVFFLAIANILLLGLGAPRSDDFVGYILALLPLLAMPLWHALYNLLLASPLSINRILFHFRLRGTFALILSANIIFVVIRPVQNLLSLAGHVILAFTAILGAFYLCSLHRKKPSPNEGPFRDDEACLETKLLCYLASILEVLFYLALFYAIFIKAPVEVLLPIAATTWIFVLQLALMLLVIAAIIKAKFFFSTSFLLTFYEDRALPFSFLLFGITSILQYYF